MADAPGHQQAHPRGGPLRGCRRGVLPGLEAGEAVLPHRAAHRDRRGRARASPAWPAPAPRSVGATTATSRSPPRWAGSSPRPTRRSSGSGRTRWRSCGARWACCKDAGTRHAGPHAALARSRGHRGGGAREPGRPAHGCGHRARLARTGAPSRSGPSTSTSGCGRRARGRRARLRRRPCTAIATSTRSCAWDHVSAGLHRDFLWQDFQEALAEHGLEDCRWTPCYDCGACTGLGVEHMVASAVPPRAGARAPGRTWPSGGAVPVRFLETRRGRPWRRGRGRDGALA